MRQRSDLLYNIFEQHLLNAIVEDESAEAFLSRVVADYMALLKGRGMILNEHLSEIEADLKDEVLEMLRKKTYGHYSIGDYRRAQSGEKKNRRSS